MATLADIRLQARERSDETDSDFITDPEANRLIQQSYADLYDILIASDEDYFVKPPLLFTIPTGSNTFTLPSDFYRLKGLDVKISGNDFENVRKFNWAKRNSRNRSTVRRLAGLNDVSYRILGNEIHILPKDRSNDEFQLWYIPQVNQLVNETDILTVISGWEEYVIVDVAIKMLAKSESDATMLLVELTSLKKRIRDLSADRDVNEPERISDVRSTRYSDIDGSQFN